MNALCQLCLSRLGRRAWRATAARGAGSRAASGGAGGGAASGEGRGGAGGGAGSPLRRLLDDASEHAEAAAGEGELHWATQPYTARPGAATTAPAGEDPRDAVVLLFPGQGAQFPGMGRRLQRVPAARDVYQLAAETLGWDVARLCAEGPEDELARRCQVAVFTTSLAAAAALADERPGAAERVRAAAGFSLGELAALTWAGALPAAQALRLVELRAAAMEAAAAARRGGMLTVWLAADARLGAALEAGREAARSSALTDPVLEVANYLYPNCKVVAGDEAALAWLEREGRAWGVRRAARVRVSGAFHTPLMAAAREPLERALRVVDVSAPRVAVYSGAEARVFRDASHVRRALPLAPLRPVRWEQTLQRLFARSDTRFPLTVALGPAAATRASLRQVNARAWDRSIQIDA